ncbi:chemotaxis protein CheR [Moraxella bovis]|uniref:Chemotaxis protein CheR n=1 Tax=Moraxella bovis TaxID=476 RepID=A0AAQ2T260_MORBO|nr:CheR family methyltransferase [Moraxella bovis]AWY21335.1 chemotaxis protein CheR [Moraxella bovis]OOR88377.1 hypothetical protein B0182_10095 [Moraxella bovis]UYZ75519.1 chemotaxis protein CheR [Moraxella bovis]UYZ78539.1 chemotaxis protein CheR [Moraxella bovis]UYZ81425.1 chemotaxis protein CheR [Moraxella bovis]
MNLPLWQAYIERICGFVLPSVQHNWLIYAITTTAQSHNMSVHELYDALQHDIVVPSEPLPALTQSLLDNLLIAESRFFRHEPSLTFVGELYKSYITKWHKATPSFDVPSMFSVWSAGCSTGQETYSLAMTLDLISRQFVRPLPFQVNGSDLSVRSLTLAKKGEYTGRQINEIPARYHSQLHATHDGVGVFNHQKIWQVDIKTRQHTQFFWHNLFAKKPLGLPKQQVIICQNVLIYFRKFDQRDILAYFVQNLDIGGCVLFAPNEAMFWQHPNMRRVDNGQINAWQKISQ